MRLVMFHENISGDKIYINPDMVREVFENPNGIFIAWENGSGRFVRESLELTFRLLTNKDDK